MYLKKFKYKHKFNVIMVSSRNTEKVPMPTFTHVERINKLSELRREAFIIPAPVKQAESFKGE